MSHEQHDHGRLAPAGQHDHAEHDHAEHDHGEHQMGSSNSMAVAATLHCLTGCAIGEVLGLMIGTALGWGNVPTLALAVALAFLFGYTLSTLPLLRAGLGIGAALALVLAADTLSIAVMELVDNAVMAAIPGAMDAGLVNPTFWVSMTIALSVAFFAAWPVNRWLLARGKGHALTHDFHGSEPVGARRFIPALSTGMLVAAIASFMLGGLVVSVADRVDDAGDDAGGDGAHSREVGSDRHLDEPLPAAERSPADH